MAASATTSTTTPVNTNEITEEDSSELQFPKGDNMASLQRKCLNHPDSFCYICGQYTFKENRKSISDFVKRAYLSYFKIKLGDQDKTWAPHIVCKTCVAQLREWTNGKSKCLKFGVPMVWREQRNHSEDCYFCLVSVKGINRQNRNKWTYPDVDSAKRPVAHSFELPVPSFVYLEELPEEEESSTSAVDSTHRQSDFDGTSSVAEVFNQTELNSLIRELNLSKQSAELLASRLAKNNLLQPGIKITYYRKREIDLLPFFSGERDFVFCNDVQGLLMKIGVSKYIPSKWRLFIDRSKQSLKCVLLHNDNKYRSIPIGYSTKMTDEQKTIALILQKMSYHNHQWSICVDLKIVNFLLGQQNGYTNYPCFICLWDSSSEDEHWVRKQWPLKENMAVREKNVIAEELVDRDKILLLPLHIKLGLMKQFVKALNKDGDCFDYICRKFPVLSMEKLKVGIFDGSQIRELMKDPHFLDSMNNAEADAWSSFTLVVRNFLGNYKIDNYSELVENMLTSFYQLGCKMNLKLHYLHSHLDRFPENLGDLTEEQGERFHQDLRTMEERYQGHWDTHMMADYCWSIQRDCPEADHFKKSLKCRFSEMSE